MNKKHLAAAFWKSALHDFARLSFQRFIVRFQAAIARHIPQENPSHPGAAWTAIWRAQMFHLNFRSGDNIWCERVSRVRSPRRRGKRHGGVGNLCIPRPRQDFSNFRRKPWAHLRHKLAWNREDCCSAAEALSLSLDFSLDRNSGPAFFRVQGACPGYHRQLARRCFGNPVHSVPQIPSPAHQQIPDHLHQNHA